MSAGTRSGRVLRLALNGCCFLSLAASGCATPSNHRTQAGQSVTDALRARVVPPHETSIAAFREAGASGVKVHHLTEHDWKRVERAIAALPPVYQRVLHQRLERLSFVDAPASAGTALTRPFDGPDGELRFDITLRADALDLSLTEFLSRKEQALFMDDGSGYTVHIEAGDAPALPYLLLHEAAHIVDRSFGITADMRPFSTLWTDYRALAEPYASGALAQSAYRRGPPLPAARMPELYQALAESPFVSLYSTASAGEDLAELLAWAQLSRAGQARLRVQVRNARGQRVVTVAPLRSRVVKSRLGRAWRLLYEIEATP